MKIITYLSIALLVLFASTVRIVRPDSFSEEFIVHDHQGDLFCSDFSEMKSIFLQPFNYLGHGQQSVAFLSKDGKYVLKLFVKKRIRYRTKIRFPFSKDLRLKEMNIPLSKGLQCYDTAIRELKDETALIGVHLNATKGDLPICKLKDWRGEEHLVDLNRVPFVLQHRCLVLDEACETMNPEDIFSGLRDFYERRTIKGFTDTNRGLNLQNFGFLGSKAVMIDPGNLEYLEGLKKNPQSEVDRIMKIAYQKIERRKK